MRLLDIADGQSELALGGGKALFDLEEASTRALDVRLRLAQPLLGELDLGLRALQAVVKIRAVTDTDSGQHEHDEGEISRTHQPRRSRLHQQPVMPSRAPIEHLHPTARPDVSGGLGERPSVHLDLHALVALSGLRRRPDPERAVRALETADDFGSTLTVEAQLALLTVAEAQGLVELEGLQGAADAVLQIDVDRASNDVQQPARKQ